MRLGLWRHGRAGTPRTRLSTRAMVCLMMAAAAFCPYEAGAFTEQVEVVEVIDGRTIRTSHGEVIRIVGEDETNELRPLYCREPEATRFAERLFTDNRTVVAHRGRDCEGRKLATVCVAGKPYEGILSEAGIGRSDLQGDVDPAPDKGVRVPRAWLRKAPQPEPKPKPRLSSKRSGSAQGGSFYDRRLAADVQSLRTAADFAERNKVKGSSYYAFQMNSYVDEAVKEARRAADVLDKPVDDITARDLHKFADSYGKVKRLESSATALQSQHGHGR